MIDADQAVAIARARAAQNGWAFGDRVRVMLRRGWFGQNDRFDVETNPAMLGTKARFVVDAVTGEILSEGYIPR